MTDFQSAVTDYLRIRQAMGYKLAVDGRSPSRQRPC